MKRLRNAFSVALALCASVQLETLSAEKSVNADADHDGTLMPADARLILRASVGLEFLY